MDKKNLYFAACIGLLALLIISNSCEVQPEPLPLPTNTSFSPTQTPTATMVWFPPTPTFTPFPTPEVLPTENMRPGIAELLLEDNFDDPQTWSVGTTETGSVAFGRDELTIVIGAEDTYLYSIRADWILSDFYLELTASPSMCRAYDEYGILLRISAEMNYYRYSLSCNGQVRLDRIYRGQASSPQPWLLSGAVPPGAPSTVKLGVWALANEMRFFVNDRYQFTVRDPLLSEGRLGVFARSTDNWPVTVNFSELVIYNMLAGE